MTPLERAARVLAPHFTDVPWGQIAADKADLRIRARNDPNRDVNEPTKGDLFAAARAVLQAIREPSEGMRKAAAKAGDDYYAGDKITWEEIPVMFTAMIDAALEEG